MPQHVSKADDDSNDIEPEAILLLINTFKKHEKEIDYAIERINSSSQLISENVKNLKFKSNRIIEELTSLEEKIREIGKKIP
jgi:hypothetical protein